MQFGGATGNSALIDDNIYGAAESQTAPSLVNGTPVQSAQLYLLSSGAAPPPSSLLQGTGASYCQCQYLQWGYWGGDLTSPSGTSMPRIDRGAINFWVAGPITPLADINKLAMQGAVGNYAGHMIGSVFNNGQQYVAAGGVNATYNFGTQTGSFAVTNYDGHSFATSGKPIVQGGGTQYSFGINTITNQGRPIAGAFNGSFYGPSAAETGGNFAFRSTAGPTYLTSGIFAAKR
jgi:trimeric autotransporter adhesin